METVWFCLVALMISIYVVLDGFDLGAGIVHLWAARAEDERKLVLGSIGPVWDGNEVWLLAAGGTLYFAFPVLAALSFSGFYLLLMIVLWLLILRGISIEFRDQIESAVWKPFWDAVFSGSSTLLTLSFGVALGNVIRGVSLGESGYFFAPLWIDLKLGRRTAILDWFTLLIGLLAVAALAQHGALWIAMKTGGALRGRVRQWADRCWWAVLLLSIGVTLITFHVQPQVPARLSAHPWGWIFPAIAVAGLIGMRRHQVGGSEVASFLSSSFYLVGMLASAAFGVYPYLLPSNIDPALGLTIHEAAAPAYGLSVGCAWWVAGMILVGIYFTFLYRQFRGKVSLTVPRP